MSKCTSVTRCFPVVCAWLLFIATTTLFFLFPCPFLTDQYHVAIPICQGIITFIVAVNFALATLMDPGIIPKAQAEVDNDDDFRTPLYKNIEINGISVRMKWCVTCQFYRPPRCSHCSTCDGCIETFDHHCPWMNNCIGRRNYRYFFMFLIFLCIHMITIFSLCIVYTLHHREQLQHSDTIVTLAIIVIITLLFVPMIGLTGFHIILVARGRTTNEQVTGKFRGGYNPFSRGCMRNVCFTLCGPLYPRIFTANKKKKKKHLTVTAPSVSANTAENRVQVYMDNSSSLARSTNSTYNKMSQGTNFSEMDMMVDSFDHNQSQSRDCEPSPPIPRHGSKTNFFSSTESNRSAYILPQNKPWSPYGSAGPPTPRGPRASIPMDEHTIQIAQESYSSWAVVNSPRSSRTPPRSLTSPVVGADGSKSLLERSSPGSPASLTPGQSPAAAKRARRGPPTPHYYGYHGTGRNARSSNRSISPNRKFVSESELARAAADKANANYEARANQTADNIQELADSGRLWDERSRRMQRPPDDTQMMQGGFRSSARRTTASPQSRRAEHKTPPLEVSPVKPYPRRPVTIVKALEMAEGFEKHNNASKGGASHSRQYLQQNKSTEDDRKSLYEMNYEISV